MIFQIIGLVEEACGDMEKRGINELLLYSQTEHVNNVWFPERNLSLSCINAPSGHIILTRYGERRNVL
jgi:hypothetical protein